MKKLLSILLAAVLAMSLLVGCSGTGSNSSTEDTDEAQTTETEETSSSVVDQMLADVETEMDSQLGEVPEKSAGEKVGILISSTSNEFWATMKTRYEEAAADADLDIEVYEASAEDDAEGQLDALNTMVSMDFDVIILSPINGTNLIPGIVAANEKDIKIINLGPGVDEAALEEAGGHLDAKITVNFEDQGKMVAEDIVKRLDGKGQVAILEGMAGAAQSEGRVKGAEDVFAQNDGIEVVASQDCNWDTDTAYEATRDIMTANPDVKAIFACNDNLALAAVQALTELGNSDVLVYGVDYTSDAKAAIEDGTMMGSMTYSSAIYTKAAISMAMNLAQGGSYDEPLYLPLTLVTQDNVADMDGWK